MVRCARRAAPRAEMTVGATRSLLKVDDSGGFTVGWRATRRDDRADIGADASKRTRRRVWGGARSLLKEDDSGGFTLGSETSSYASVIRWLCPFASHCTAKQAKAAANFPPRAGEEYSLRQEKHSSGAILAQWRFL